MAEPIVTVGVQADPADLARIATNTQSAFGKGAQAGAKEAAAAIKQTLTPAFEALNREAAKVGSSGASAGFGKLGDSAQAAGRQLSAVSRDSLNIVQAFKDIGAGLTAAANAINRETSTMARSSIEANSQATRASNASLIELRNAGKQAAIEAQTSGQIQVREARTSGQQRVQITRSVLDTIGRLEKGLGTTLAGIARTSVGAVSKAFDGLASVFKRSDKEVFNTSTFSSSLKERESVLKSSFSRQEATVRESVSRQERQLTELRDSANSGILGAANRSGLLGGLAVGFAALSAVKSTFTVGADFTRGLAVLQASLNLTADDMKKVRQTSIDLGNDITLPGVSALDAAQAIQTLTKQFGALGPTATQAALDAAKGTLQLARASGSSADDAAALIGSAVNVFKIGANDAVGAADKITGALTRAAGVGFTDFKDSFIQGATVFEQFVGASEDANSTLLDFNTTLAILAKNGITGATAGAGLKQFFLQATSGTDKANKANAELAKRAGVTGGIFFDAAGKSRQFADSIEILRKGVVGLNNESRKQTLSALFGSRSITIANALINSTGESFATLRNQINQQGLAAKIAAAQNTGLKGALDALSSVVETVQIVFFEKVQKPIGQAVLALTNLANAVLFGAAPALHTLRIALLGVIAGIGALVGLKTAVEVLSLLGKTAALAFTPFGALVALFAASGAAIALFSDKSKFLGDAFTKIKDEASLLGDELVAKAKPVIESISNFIQGTAIPTAQRWAGIVGRDLKGAFEGTVGFVRDTVIPGFQRFVGVLESDVFPKVASIAQTVGNAVVTARDKVVSFARDIGGVVGPLIQPAIDGFKQLGSALGDLIAGNFSTIGSGLASAGKGIGSAFANIGQALLPSLQSLGSTVLGFLKDLFSTDHLITAIGGLGDFLNFIGQKLGEIVSNPKVIAAVAIIAATAARLAFDFVSGIVEGIASNIPQLLADAWQLAVKFAFKPDVLIAAIGAVLIGTQLVAPLINAFRNFGTSTSKSFASGFSTGIKSAFSSSTGFLGSLLTGNNGATAFGPITTGSKEFTKQLQAAQNEARILGSTKIYDRSAAGLAAAKTDIDGLGRGLTDAQKKGLALRDSISVAFRAIGGIGTGVGGIGSGLAQIPLAFGKAGVAALKAFGDKLSFSGSKAFASFFGGEPAITSQGAGVGRTFGSALRDGLNNAKSTIVGGFKSIGDALKTASAESGRSIGSILGEGLAKGIGAALSGAFFGRQIGEATSGLDQGLGIAGLLSSAVALGPVAGTAALAIGGLTAAFTSNQKEAEAAKKRVDDYANELLGHLKDGQITATGNQLTLNSALADNADAVAQITANLGTKLVNALVNAGIHQSDLITAFSKGDAAVQAFEQTTGAALVKSGVGITAAGLAVSAIDKTYREFGAGVKQTNDQLAFTADPLGKISTGALSLVHNMTNATTAIGDAATAASTFGQAVLDANVTGGSAGTGKIVDAFKDINTQIAAVQTKVNKGIVPGGTPSNVQPALDVASALQNIKDLKTDIDAQFATGILPPGVTQFQDTLNQAILAVQGGGGTIQKAFEDAGKALTEGGITVDVRAAIDANALKLLGDNVSKVIQQGVSDGTIIDAASARAAVEPLKREFENGVTDPTVIAQIEDAFNNIIITLTPTVDAATAASQTQAAIDGAQIIANGQIINIPSGVDIPIAGPEFAGEAQAAVSGIDVQIPVSFKLSDVGSGDALDSSSIAQQFRGGSVVIPTTVAPPTIPAGFAVPAIAAGASAGSSTGRSIDNGIINGIRIGSADVAAAAAAMANRAVAAANRALGVSSPSKVFFKIGQFVIAGFVGAIQEGTGDVESSITDLVGKAVDAATGALTDASRQLRSGNQSLFDALFGSSSAQGKSSLGGLQGDITVAFQSLGSTIGNSVSTAADVLKRSATEALSNADLDILGELATSLNPNDVLGASNRAALVGSIDDIVNLGKSLIDQGVPAAQVTQTMQGYLDHLRQLGVQYGLNITDVNGVIDSLGLGSDALASFVDASTSLEGALGHVTTSAFKLNQAALEMFANFTDGKDVFKSLQGVGKSEDARAAVLAGASALASAIDAVDTRAQDIIDKRNAGQRLNNADQLALNQGLNNRAINLTDQLGVANRAAFQAQIDNIKNLGEALLAGGSTIDFVNSQIRDQITALENYGVSLGFSRDAIDDLVNKSGLGADNLALLAKSISDAAAAAAASDAAQNAATQNALASLPGPGGLPAAGNQFTPATDTTGGQGQQPTVLIREFNLSVPYGDPQAIALAAANGVAVLARLPGS